MKEKKVEKISDLEFDQNNYNKHSAFGMSLLESSLSKLGAGRSILIDKNNKIIAGNGIVEMAAAIGLEDIQIVESDGKRIIAVKRTDLDLDTKRGKEMALADNATSKANLEWDYEAMSADFESVELEAWGVFAEESEGGFGDNSLNSEAQEDDFEVPEVETVKTDIVLGDLFEIGPHRLLCGDSTRAEDVERLMGGERADMVFTDPPYGIAYSGERFDNVKAQSVGLKRNTAEMIAGDEKPFDPSFILELSKKVKEVFVWGYQYYPEKLGRGGIIVWNKKTESQADCAHGDFELCFSKQERNRMFWHTWGGFKNKETGENRLHTTQKPVALPSFFFNEWGKDGELVVDYFLGSGTTMVAAHQLNRKCYGMELSEKYCQVVVDRMQKLDPTLEIKKNGQPYRRMAQ